MNINYGPLKFTDGLGFTCGGETGTIGGVGCGVGGCGTSGLVVGGDGGGGIVDDGGVGGPIVGVRVGLVGRLVGGESGGVVGGVVGGLVVGLMVGLEEGFVEAVEDGYLGVGSFGTDVVLAPDWPSHFGGFSVGSFMHSTGGI